MILLIDAGNTRIKLGWLKQVDGEANTGMREAQPLALTYDALADTLPTWLASLPDTPRQAIGVNVAGAGVAARLKALLPPDCRDIHWIQSTAYAARVINGYRQPGQLGADRWLALIGTAGHARHLADSPLLLANFGTATTIDALGPIQHGDSAQDQAGMRRFHGGLILPGVQLMRTSLHTGTANLPMNQGSVALHPDHTLQAIATGIAAAQAGAVWRQWLALLATFGTPPRIFVSGGAWPEVCNEVTRLFAHSSQIKDPDVLEIQWLASPVLDGLAQLAHASQQ